ncbi:MAG TPA: hypothetical protein VH951_04260 [Dehalococcoidia bacterium]|jgi:hypothetical protein
MAAPRKLPRPFEMHWGSGQIVEEASHSGEYHESCIQLMRYDNGEAAGGWSIRFCSYSPRGGFQRSPLMVGAEDIDGLRAALQSTPELRSLLKRLIE